MGDTVDGNTEVSWLEWGFKGAVALFGIVFGWIGNTVMAAVKQLRSDHMILKDLVRDHELEDARMYVTKQDFKDTVIEMKDTVKRSHDRLDDMAGDISDIKTLVVQALSTKYTS
jgi:hypothetical protein